MKQLRIVLVMVEPPLPFGNAVSRWYYVLLKGLLERGHGVTAFATCGSQKDIEASYKLFPSRTSLRCYEHAKVGYLASKLAALQRPHSYLFSPELTRDLEAELQRDFDVLHIEGHWGAWTGLAHSSRAILNVHYLFKIDLADQYLSSVLERARLARTIQAEHYLLRRYPLICTLSPRLSAEVQGVNPAAEVHTISFGMDLSQYPFEASRNPADRVVTLIGSFNWMPTYSAAVRLLERLWPAIHQRVPGSRLQLVGRRALERLGQYTDIAGIEIYEDVPDTLPYFRQASVLVYAPGRGSGVKVKVIESFCLGLPVVTTAEGVEGIPAVDGVHAGICEDDAGLIERTITLLENPPARERQSREARAMIERHCAPDAALEALEEVYSRVIHRHSREGVA